MDCGGLNVKKIKRRNKILSVGELHNGGGIKYKNIRSPWHKTNRNASLFNFAPITTIIVRACRVAGNNVTLYNARLREITWRGFASLSAISISAL